MVVIVRDEIMASGKRSSAVAGEMVVIVRDEIVVAVDGERASAMAGERASAMAGKIVVMAGDERMSSAEGETLAKGGFLSSLLLISSSPSSLQTGWVAFLLFFLCSSSEPVLKTMRLESSADGWSKDQCMPVGGLDDYG